MFAAEITKIDGDGMWMLSLYFYGLLVEQGIYSGTVWGALRSIGLAAEDVRRQVIV